MVGSQNIYLPNLPTYLGRYMNHTADLAVYVGTHATLLSCSGNRN